jgi:hypothetical protein
MTADATRNPDERKGFADMSDEERLAGLTKEQRWYIDRAAEEAATRAVDKFSQQLTKRPFPLCSDIEDVKAAVFGSTERGIVGLDAQTKANVDAIASMRRLGWLLLTATVSAIALGAVELAIEIAVHIH